VIRAAVGLTIASVGGIASFMLLLTPPAQAGLCLGQASAQVKLDPQQAANAATITATIGKAGMSSGDTYIADVDAISAALQESRLHNLPTGDRDSMGLFQQRPSQGWGTAQAILDPMYSTSQFLNHLRAIPGWDAMPVGRAVQAVQQSSDKSGGTYQAQSDEAMQIVDELVGTPCASASAAAQTAGASSFLCPVPKPVLTQPFGPTNLGGEPLVNGHPFHMGMDLAVPAGTPIRAAAAGRVAFAGTEVSATGLVTGYGQYVTIQDTLGRTELYGHLSEMLTAQGLAVQAGQEIGLVGSTGVSTGPHVHFEVRVNGQAVNPAPNLRCSF
jgi:hypothetical protein